MNFEKFCRLINLQDYGKYSFLNNLVVTVLESTVLEVPRKKILDNLKITLGESIYFSTIQKNIIYNYIASYLDDNTNNAISELRKLLNNLSIGQLQLY